MKSISENQGQPTVVLCDRSAQDSAAYVSETDYAAILDEHGWSKEQLLARANCVIHLITAADGKRGWWVGGSGLFSGNRENGSTVRSFFPRQARSSTTRRKTTPRAAKTPPW
jgi:hypothetical protein